MHYTQQPSRISWRAGSSVLHVQMQGFVTASMLSDAISTWERHYGARLPVGLVLDLHEVSGYGRDVAELARAWLSGARERGIRRIAFVAGSSVLRTVVRVISPIVPAELRCFGAAAAALEWVEGRGAAKKATREPPPPAP
jgi:hypothetical protein